MEKSVDGSFHILEKKNAISITVTPPREGGQAVTLEQVKEELKRLNLVRVDWKRCEQAVRQAARVPVNIIAGDGMYLLEMDEEGLFLTVYPPVPGGTKVSLFSVRQAIEKKSGHVSDDRELQHLVSMPSSRRQKIGEAHGAVRVQVAADRLAAEMIVAGPNGGRPAEAEAANQALQEARVSCGLIAGAVEEALRPENWGKSVVVAQGRPPKEGTDGQLLEHYVKSKTHASLQDRLGGSILEPTLIVEKGEVLVEKVPAVPGEDGVDVAGHPLRCRKFRDPELPAPGANVEADPGGLKLAATARGVPVAGGKRLSVEPPRHARVVAPDVARAVEIGRQVLGLAEGEVGHEVEKAGQKGLLGIGGVPFQVRVFHQASPLKEAEKPVEPAKAAPAPAAKVLPVTDERPARTVEIAADRDSRRELSLHRDADSLRVFLTVRLKSGSVTVGAEEIRALLEKAGTAVPDEQRAGVEQFLDTLAEGPVEIPWKLLASGRAPRPGRDAPVKWAIDLGEARPQEDERADYYEVTKFVSVAPGDLLFTLGEPEPGMEGTDIYGRPIPAQPGRAVPLEAGEGVRYQEDGKSCVAVASGTADLKKEVVSVRAVYRVKGDVDFHVGNIDFNGSVDVGGNILDNFKVKAALDLYVGGNIESAEVEVGRDLRVRNGITGHEKGKIRAGGKVETKYINGATVIADGDVNVRVQILNSTVLSRERVIVGRGGIVGGVTAAMHEVRSAVLGSEMGVRTNVVAGIDMAATARVEEIERSLGEMDPKIAQIESALLPFVQSPELLEGLPPEKREAAGKLALQVRSMKARRDALSQERDRLSQPPATTPRPVIIVSRCVFNNVDVRVGPFCHMRVTAEMSGPIKLRANEEKGTVESYRA